jgi:hypothetical protein
MFGINQSAFYTTIEFRVETDSLPSTIRFDKASKKHIAVRVVFASFIPNANFEKPPRPPALATQNVGP